MDKKELLAKDSTALSRLREVTVEEKQQLLALSEQFDNINSKIAQVHVNFETLVAVLAGDSGYQFEIIINSIEDNALGVINYVAVIEESRSYDSYMSARRDFYEPKGRTCNVVYERRLSSMPTADARVAKEDFVPTLISSTGLSEDSLDQDEVTVDQIVSRSNQTLELLWVSAADPKLNPGLSEAASAFLQQCADAKQIEH